MAPKLGLTAQSANAQAFARIDKVQNDIKARLAKLAPYAEAERLNDYLLLRLPFELRIKILDLALPPLDEFWFCYITKAKNADEVALHCFVDKPKDRMRLEAALVMLQKSTIEIRGPKANNHLTRWLSNIDYTLLSGDTAYESGYDAVKALSFPLFIIDVLHGSGCPKCYPSLNTGCHDDATTERTDSERRCNTSDEVNEHVLLMQRCKNLAHLSMQLTESAIVARSDPQGIGLIELPPRLVDDHFGPPPSKYMMSREYTEFGTGLLELKNLRRLQFTQTLKVGKDETEGIDAAVKDHKVMQVKKWLADAFAGQGSKVDVTVSFDVAVVDWGW